MYNVKRFRVWNDDIVLCYVNVIFLVFIFILWLIVLVMLIMMVYNY